MSFPGVGRSRLNHKKSPKTPIIATIRPKKISRVTLLSKKMFIRYSFDPRCLRDLNSGIPQSIPNLPLIRKYAILKPMNKLTELLTRGVDAIYPTRESLEDVLKKGKKLRLYQGFDPTGTQLHIGHMIGLRKLRQWQDLGHHVIFLIGDGTGQAGDPSGKKKSREKYFTREELRQNATDYVKQASKIVRFDGKNPVEILFNGDWLNKLTLVDLLQIAGHFSLQQLSERDIFQQRIQKGESVNLREFLYPLLQAYDSVAMSVDLEVGGSDQTFNMLAGRTLVKATQNRDKFVMTTPLLADSKGVKIGKTEGNVVALTDNPKDLFGKIMALPDEIIVKGLEYLTDVPIDEIQSIELTMTKGTNPIQYKKLLAYHIVKQLHSEEHAKTAEVAFQRVVQQDELPSVIPEYIYSGNPQETIIDLLTKTKLVASKSEAKRLVEQGGIEIDSQKITDPTERIAITDNMLLKLGKRRFIRIKYT